MGFPPAVQHPSNSAGSYPSGPVGPFAVVLEDRHHGQVLHDVVGLLERLPLARVGAGVHAHAVGRAAERQRFAQVGGVDRDACRDLQPSAPVVGEAGAGHGVALPVHLDETVAVDHFERRFRRRFGLEDAVGDARLELRGAHPARPERLRAAVVAAQGFAELVPEARGEAVVTVDGRYALRREHAAEHGRRLHDEGRNAFASGGDGRRSARGRAADHQHVHRAAGRVGAGGKSDGGGEREGCREEGGFHGSCRRCFICIVRVSSISGTDLSVRGSTPSISLPSEAGGLRLAGSGIRTTRGTRGP